jgi:hypothetical protein
MKNAAVVGTATAVLLRIAMDRSEVICKEDNLYCLRAAASSFGIGSFVPVPHEIV